MALTPFQRRICHLLADRRRVDVFHDTTEAVARTWDADRELLLASGYAVVVVRERPGFVQAVASLHGDQLLIEWTRDSAFRFFPLLEHPDLGLTLHPFDLATNKVLALIGRAEVRDWLDVLLCDREVQPFGYLAWAACGKDPGFTPTGILEHARRSTHYSQPEVAALAFDGDAPSLATLSSQWQSLLGHAADIVGALPAELVGHAVLTPEGVPFRGDRHELQRVGIAGLRFHQGRIGGALPVTRAV